MNVVEKPDFLSWTKNVVDKYKKLSVEQIKSDMAKTSLPAAILMGQIQSDFNIGSVIRTANNFNLSKVFYFGKRRYDRRGTVGTYHYTDVVFLQTLDDIIKLKEHYHFVGLENNVDKKTYNICDYSWKKNSLIIVGEENSGIPSYISELCDDFIEIPSMGSVRSLNAAVASSIAMFDYISKTERHK